MAGFGFTKEQDAFRLEMRRFAKEEVAPTAIERHRTQTEIPVEIRRKLGKMGLMGYKQPKEYGGHDGEYVSLAIAIEEICKADFLVGGNITMPYAAIMAIGGGPKETKDEWIPGLISGEFICPPANTEEHCGSDAAAIKTTAVKDGDSYILKGEKTAICQCMNAHAAIVYAKTDPAAGFRGVTAFLVPMNTPGITRYPISYIGWKPQGLGGFFMDNVRIPERYRVSKEGEGFYLAMSQFDFLRVGIAINALAMAQSALEKAIEYTKKRMVFGKPAASFQGTSFKLVEHATMIELGRLMCYRALYMNDQGQRHTKESAMAKWYCPKIAQEAIHDCVLAMGHYGYTIDMPVAEILRDVVGHEIGDGVAQVMKTVLVRELIGKEYV
ncbi:MAG: acyl-CoA dehydrogenase family protein [Dehalococcoidia bacterium]